jgi:hypothetical protein
MAHNLPPLWFLRIIMPVYLFCMGVAARIPGDLYCRFVILPDWCKCAVKRGQNDRATTLAQELLDLAHRYPNDWNYGNAIHHGHMVLGRVALAAGDVAKARAELLAAGQTPGSPQLNSFGPNMRLAQELLRVGEHDVVLEYFEHCRRFWSMGDKRLAEWIDDIARGRAPNFGPNLDY